MKKKNITGKELKKEFLKRGWTLVSVSGSHFKLEKNNVTAIIPVHGNKTLKIGTLHQLLEILEENENGN